MSTNDERSHWAEELDSFGPESTVISGSEAAAQGRAVLESALGGPESVERALRGRRPLDGARAPGYRSPSTSFRLTAAMAARLAAISNAQKRQQSDIIRDALAEYIERHPV